jgi:hypothetical protein
MRSFLRRLSLAALLTLAPLTAQAGASNTAPIPPAPRAAAPLPASPAAPTRVGRLSLVCGKLGFRAAGAADWSAAVPNLPVAAGEALRTDAQSRAALEIGPHTLDIAPGSEVDIAGLDRHLIALRLPQGRLYLHLRQLGAGESVTVAIPRGGVRLSRPGEYDIDSGSQTQPARVAVFAGRAHFSGGGGAATAVKAGQTATLAGLKPVTVTLARMAAADDFDLWARAQDYRQSGLAAPYFISPEMAGYAALDGHGSWQRDGRYGAVWYPAGLPANWAPYRDGHWQRIAPWGWTWIDAQPWGFAPFHYGRWALIGRRWAWVPGRFVAHPAYVPAAVAFLGTPGVGLSVAGSSVPAIGWFPLAPGEVYWPSYSRNLDYVRKLNRGDVADPAAIALNPDGNPPVAVVTGHFADRQMASVVSRPDFVAGRPVATALLYIPGERLRNAPVITGSPRLGPAALPWPEVAVARAAPANAAPRKPDTLVARRPPAKRPVRVAVRRIVVKRVAVRRFVKARPIWRRERRRVAHLRAPAYAGRALRSRRLVAYRRVHVVRRMRRR